MTRTSPPLAVSTGRPSITWRSRTTVPAAVGASAIDSSAGIAAARTPHAGASRWTCMRAAVATVGAWTCTAGPPCNSRGMPCSSTANGVTPRSIAAATGVIFVIGTELATAGGAPPDAGAGGNEVGSLQLSTRAIGARNRGRVWVPIALATLTRRARRRTKDLLTRS